MTHYTRWNFTMVTDKRMSNDARSITLYAEIEQLRKSRDAWRDLAWWAAAGFAISVLTMMYYGLKG